MVDCARLPMLNLPLYHRSSQLFDLRVSSSTEVWVLLLNQPIISYCKSVFYNFSTEADTRLSLEVKGVFEF